MQRKVLEYFSKNPCVDCGEINTVLLEFDHVEGKEFTIAQAVSKGYSWKRIQSEIQKCVVRCVSCHRLKTASQERYYSWKFENQHREEDESDE